MGICGSSPKIYNYEEEDHYEYLRGNFIIHSESPTTREYDEYTTNNRGRKPTFLSQLSMASFGSKSSNSLLWRRDNSKTIISSRMRSNKSNNNGGGDGGGEEEEYSLDDSMLIFFSFVKRSIVLGKIDSLVFQSGNNEFDVGSTMPLNGRYENDVIEDVLKVGELGSFYKIARPINHSSSKRSSTINEKMFENYSVKHIKTKDLKKTKSMCKNHSCNQCTSCREAVLSIQLGSHPNILSMLEVHKNDLSQDMFFYMGSDIFSGAWMNLNNYFVFKRRELRKINDNIVEINEESVRKMEIRFYESHALFVQLLQGLYWIHYRKMIHQDVKPYNILINMSSKKLKLSGFGLSAMGEEVNGELLAPIKGLSPEWASPEVNKIVNEILNSNVRSPDDAENLLKDQFITPAITDIFSCGLVGMQLVTYQTQVKDAWDTWNDLKMKWSQSTIKINEKSAIDPSSNTENGHLESDNEEEVFREQVLTRRPMFTPYQNDDNYEEKGEEGELDQKVFDSIQNKSFTCSMISSIEWCVDPDSSIRPKSAEEALQGLWTTPMKGKYPNPSLVVEALTHIGEALASHGHYRSSKMILKKSRNLLYRIGARTRSKAVEGNVKIELARVSGVLEVMKLEEQDQIEDPDSGRSRASVIHFGMGALD